MITLELVPYGTETRNLEIILFLSLSWTEHLNVTFTIT